MAFEPVNHAAILGQAMGLQGDYRADQQRQALLSLQQDEMRQRQQVFAAQQAKAQREVEQQQAYQAAVGEFIKNPTAQAAANLQAQFPEYGEQIKSSWATRDRAAQDSDLRELGAIFGYLNAGAIDKAKAAIQRRIEADRAAGQDTSDDEAVLALIDENPEQAKGVTAHLLASVGGSDKYAAILEQTRLGGKDQAGFTLSQGQTRYDADGNVIASVAPETEYLVIPEGGKAVPKGSLAGGGGQASGGAGGGAPRSVRNNNPGNLRDSPFTRGLPGYQGADSGGFAVFDTPTNGAGAQSALLQSYMNRGFNTVSKIISRWAPPSDGNDTGGYVKMVASAMGVKPGDVLSPAQIPALQQAIARVEGGSSSPSNGQRNGDPAGTLYGDPKPVARPMTAAEKQEWGLPADVAYKMGPDGPVAIGGQDTRTKQGRPVPDSTAKRVESAVDQRESLNRALRNFKDDFGGNTITGGLENWLQGRFATGTPGQREWWADFYRTDNQIRNDLFGSALTATEQAAYERTSINPSISAQTIRDNLKARASVIEKALARQQRFLKANKYDSEAVDALYASDALGTGTPIQVRSAQEFNALVKSGKLPSGTVYIDPTGVQRRRP